MLAYAHRQVGPLIASLLSHAYFCMRGSGTDLFIGTRGILRVKDLTILGMSLVR